VQYHNAVTKAGKARLAIAAIVTVVAGGIATVAALHRSPYAFLDCFHPRRVEVDVEKLWASLPSRVPRPAELRKETLLVFRQSDSAAVLAAMNRELTPGRGFRAEDRYASLRKTGSDLGVAWQFLQGPPLGPGVTPVAGESALFMSGRGAAVEEVAFEQGSFKVAGLPSSESEPCIVILDQRESWIERYLDAVRRFLHL